MKSNITAEDVKKAATLSDSELEKKLKEVLSSKSGAAGVLKNINVDAIKNQIKTKSPDDLAKLINKLGKIDSELINKIKKSLN